jgi:hypothetical protein
VTSDFPLNCLAVVEKPFSIRLSINSTVCLSHYFNQRYVEPEPVFWLSFAQANRQQLPSSTLPACPAKSTLSGMLGYRKRYQLS